MGQVTGRWTEAVPGRRWASPGVLLVAAKAALGADLTSAVWGAQLFHVPPNAGAGLSHLHRKAVIL